MDLTLGNTKSTVTMGGGGMPVITTGVPGSSAVGNMGFAHAPGGLPYAEGNIQLPTPLAGKRLPLLVKQPVSAAALGAALGRFASKVIMPLTVGMALYDFAKEIGFDLSGNVGGPATITWTDPNSYCSADCFIYLVGSNTTQYHSESDACSGYASWQNVQGYSYSFGNPRVEFIPAYNADYCKTDSYSKSTGGYVSTGTYAFSKYSVSPWGTPVVVSKSADDFANAVAGYAGYPSTSHVDDAIGLYMKNGGVLDLSDPVIITAPSGTGNTGTLAGDPTNVIQSDGSGKMEQTGCTWVADLAGIVNWQCSTSTTTTTAPKTEVQTVVTTNPDGSTSTGTITKVTPQTVVTTSTDNVDPTKGQDPCATQSSRIGCLNIDTPQTPVPTSSKSVTYGPDDLGLGAGACPAPISMTVHGGTYTVSYQAACDFATSILKPVLLAIAAMMAYFIVAGGVGREV